MTFFDHRADYGYAITTPNGDTIRRIIDRDDCRRSLVTNCATYFNSSPVDSNAYAFDALSRPVSLTTGTTGILPVASTFAYNDRSEVLSAAIGTNLFTHAYDDIGNHLLFGDNATTNTFTHNQVNQMVGRGVLDVPPTTTFTYTPDGGLSSDGTWTYAYDAEDQLLSVTSSSLTNGAIRVLNSYDYRHRRTSKTVQRLYSTIAPPPSPPVGIEEWQTLETRTFVYDDWNLIHETIYAIDGGTTNVTEVQYFWGLDLSDTLQGAGGVGGLLAVSRNGLFYFPAYDNTGNVTKYIDESGNVVAAYEYDDFGRIISQSGPLADFFRHRFSTKYYDAETGLYYYGYRYYSPVLMRWFNRDTKEENGGINLYGFCKDSPLIHIDALGLIGTAIGGNYVYSPSGTYADALLDFLDGGSTKHYWYSYPDAATSRLLSHPSVQSVWRQFVNTHCGKSHDESGIIFYTASGWQFFRDIWTIWGTYKMDNTINTINNSAHDWGYEVLGSFEGHYTIHLDCQKCVKTLNMRIYNSFTVESLTRIPFLGTSLIKKNFFNPVHQTFAYDVEWNAAYDGKEIRSK